MKKAKLLILSCVLCTFLQTAAQQIAVSAVLGGKNVVLNDSSFVRASDRFLRLQTLKFYLSGIVLLQDADTIFKVQNSFYLVDFAHPESRSVSLAIPKKLKYNRLTLLLGVDSGTNAAGVKGGDLDPAKGMYWTWHSGYINAKMEGDFLKGAQSSDFVYHLGGYQQPFYCGQEMAFRVVAQQTIRLSLDLDTFFRLLQREQQLPLLHIMSPGKDAVLLSRLLALCFRVL